ncbi:MAG: amino acid adenylation domain-containing protein, partial [Myxococcota bacterium]
MVADEVGLTRRQLLMWIEHTLDPLDPHNNMAMTYEIAGRLDLDRFRRAFEYVVRTTEALRTVFVNDGQEVAQSFPESHSVQYEYVDLSDEQPSGVQAWLDARVLQPFDLSERAYDAVLLRTGPDAFVWYFCQHHIITDGWSFALIYHRIEDTYRRMATGAELPSSGPQFAAYVGFENKFRSSSAFDAGVEYWRNKLLPAPPALSFYGQPNPGGAHALHRHTFILDADHTDGLWRHAEHPDVFVLSAPLSRLIVLLTLVTAYLTRITGESDITIAVPMLNRGRKPLKATVGPVLEINVVRVQTTPDDSFTSLASRIGREVINGLRHLRSGVSNPAYQRAYDVMLNYHGTSFESFDGLPTKTTAFSARHARDYGASHEKPGHQNAESLIIEVSDFDATGMLRFDFDLSAGVADAATSRRAVKHFERLLKAFIESPDRAVDAVDILTEDERVLFDGLNQTARVFDGPRTVTEQFEAQVRRTPDAIAVADDEKTLTYEQLDTAGRRVAHRLRQMNIRPTDRVAVCLSRSVDLFVALIGVLKTGAAYIPLDPVYPAERVIDMVDDAQPKALITEASQPSGFLQDSEALSILQLDIEWENDAPLDERFDVEAHVPQPEDPLYIMYTSGSTGRPKGVIASHRATMNRLSWMWTNHPFQPGERACQKTALSFVDSVWEIFGPLLQGVPTRVIPDEVLVDQELLVDVLANNAISRIVLVPSLLSTLLRLFDDLGERLPSLRWWTVSGEALPRALAAEFAVKVPHGRLLNLYGSTEVAADVTYFDASAQALGVSPVVPIGRPIANTEVFVLNPSGIPCPPGVAGELHVAGASLAIGYAGHAGQSKERQDSFGEYEGRRVFRTKDQCRFRSDGQLEYLGRRDHQAKLRGQRLDLQEIEGLLREQPGVQDIAVAVIGTNPTLQQLVAFIVAPEVGEGAESGWRSALQSRLPRYMVPTAWRRMPSLPKTPNGKLD